MKKNIKLNQKGIAHHLLLIVLAVLVVGAIGFAGYRIYSNKKLDAQAERWTKIASVTDYRGHNVYLYACSVDLGHSWRVQMKAYNGSAASISVTNFLNRATTTQAYGRMTFSVVPYSWSQIKNTQALKKVASHYTGIVDAGSLGGYGSIKRIVNLAKC